MIFAYFWIVLIVGFVLGAVWKSMFMVTDTENKDPYDNWK